MQDSPHVATLRTEVTVEGLPQANPKSFHKNTNLEH